MTAATMVLHEQWMEDCSISDLKLTIARGVTEREVCYKI